MGLTHSNICSHCTDNTPDDYAHLMDRSASHFEDGRDIVSSILDNNLYIFDSSFGVQMLKNSATLMGSCKSGWWRIYFLVIIDVLTPVSVLIMFSASSGMSEFCA